MKLNFRKKKKEKEKGGGDESCLQNQHQFFSDKIQYVLSQY
jgi:hypothetical protein